MKKNFNNALYSSFGFIFPVALTLITTPYIVHKLTAEVFGIYVIAMSLMGVMSFLNLGFGHGTIKFISQYEAKKDYERINKIVGTTLFVYLIMGIIGFTVTYCLSDFLTNNVFNISDKHKQLSATSFRLIGFGFIVSLINGIFFNISKALQRYDLSVKIQNGVWFLSNISIVILLYSEMGLISILTTWIFFQFCGIIIFWHVTKKILPSLKIAPELDSYVFKEMFGFSFFAAVENITASIAFKADKLIIGILMGTEFVAYYSVPFMIVQIANGFVGSASQFLFPIVSSMYSCNDTKRLKQLYMKSIRYSITLSLVIAGCLLLIGKSFLILWMGEEFAEKSAHIIPIISLIFFFLAVLAPAYWYYNGMGKSSANMVCSLVGTFCQIGFSFILIPKLGLTGAAIALAFILILCPVYAYMLNKLLTISNTWFFAITVKSILILALTVAASNLIQIPPKIEWVIITGAIVLVYIAFAAYFLKIIYMEDFLEIRHNLIKI